MTKSANIKGGPQRLLRRERAAHYVDVSPSSFDNLVKKGHLPSPKLLEHITVWDRFDLDSACDHLPYKKEEQNLPDNSWDD
jgi:predicted DNA-binding transcriptional regulator AlpA